MPLKAGIVLSLARFGRCACAAAFVLTFAILGPQRAIRAQSGSILVQALDEDGRPLPGAAIEGHKATPDASLVCGALTDAQGRGILEGCGTSELQVTVTLAGYLAATADIAANQRSTLELTLVSAPAVHQR